MLDWSKALRLRAYPRRGPGVGAEGENYLPLLSGSSLAGRSVTYLVMVALCNCSLLTLVHNLVLQHR